MNKTIKLILILVFVLFSVHNTFASRPETTWCTGHVLLWNQAVLEGNVSYNWSAEMVLLRQFDGRIRAFSANQVSQFSWFDVAQSKQRAFVSLPNSTNKNLANQAFFEVAIDGPLAVVRRLRQRNGLLKRLFSHPVYFNDHPTMAQNLDHFNYFVYDAGRLLALDRFYADIYQPLMTTYGRELRRYIVTHNINERTLSGRLVVINQYNALVQKDSKTASAKRFTGVPN